VFCWFGTDSHHSDKVDLIRRWQKDGSCVLMFEAGWTLDRNQCLQIDMKGTQGEASWAEDPFTFDPEGPIPIRESGDLLVCLRYERNNRPTDNVAILSPWFPNNLAWVRHLQQVNPNMRIRIRPHFATSEIANRPIKHLVNRMGWAWDDSSIPFRLSIKQAKAVAVIDSTAAVQAIELGLPVLCFGKQVFRFPHVVCCLTNDVAQTHEVITQLEQGYCDIDRGAVKGMLTRIRSHQWYSKDIDSWPDRLTKEFGL
jgi:hypothetical protein